MYTVNVISSAKGDLRKIKHSHLQDAFDEVVDQLERNPYYPNQGFEKLWPPSEGKYSRRLNIQHRVVYSVDQKKKVVTIYAAWSHYE